MCTKAAALSIVSTRESHLLVVHKPWCAETSAFSYFPVGNLHPDTTCEDICNTIRGGILQEMRYIPDRHICFVSFVMAESALALYQYAVQVGITVKNRRLKIGWGKNSGPCPPGIAAIVAAGGSRNVYIGNV